jgi:hypothetical protein
MSPPSQPPPASSASRLIIPFDIPAYWTPEQALAVVELLDDLRERIWTHYDVRLIDLIQTEHRSQAIEIEPTASTGESDF